MDTASRSQKLALSHHHGPLFGRKEEVKLLREIQERVFESNDSLQVCFVHGESGSGKTSLCRQLSHDRQHDGEVKKQRWDRHFYFVEGKFDQFQQQHCAVPYSALVQAFDSLGRQVCESAKSITQASDPDKNNSLEESREDDLRELKAALELEGQVLRGMIPSFAELFEPPEEGTNAEGLREQSRSMMMSSSSGFSVGKDLDLASKRLAVAFQVFLNHFCTPSRPLVLFVDDLQWADENSLEVLASILNNKEAHNLLFLGGYRDEEAEYRVAVDAFRQTLHVPISANVAVKNLDDACANALVASMLSREVTETHELSSLVCRKTLGNPFYILQLLGVLERRQVLSYNLLLAKWEWDMEQVIANTSVSDNVASIVTQRIQSVSRAVQRLLQLAACLGFQIDKRLLEKVYHTRILLSINPEPQGDETADEGNDFENVAAAAEANDLMETAGSALRFCHDRIRQFSYELLPKEGSLRRRVHYDLGKCLCEYFQGGIASRSHRYLMLAADQLNRGSEFAMQNQDDRLALVQLNLTASRMAHKRSAEGLVFDFLNQAASLVDDSDWEPRYDVVLEIFNRLAEVESARSNYTRSDELAEVILRHAKLPEDTASALSTQARSFFFQCDHKVAMIKARRALAVLGVRPRSSTLLNLLFEIARVRRMVRGMRDEQFLSLPAMKEWQLKKAMRLLVSCIIYGIAGNDRYSSVLMICKMMELTIRHGLCGDTAIAYAAYGQILSQLGKRDEAYRFSILALRAKPSREAFPCTTTFVHALCLHFKLPLASSLEPCIQGYRVGLEAGDMFFGPGCLATYLHLYVVCGLPLKTFVSDCKNFTSQLQVLGVKRVLGKVLSHMLLGLSLTGELDDPYEITFEKAKEVGYLDDERQIPGFMETPAKEILIYHRMFVALIMGNMDRAQKEMNNSLSLAKKDRKFVGTNFANYMFRLQDGLVGMMLFEKTGRQKYLKIARQGMRYLKTMRTINSLPVLQLLEAQHAAQWRASKQEVKRSFDKAIVSLARAGHTHFRAIACEKAGIYMLQRHDDEYWAKEYLHQALTLYQEYCATIKVDQMVASYQDMLTHAPSRRHPSQAILGRSRFESIVLALRAGPSNELSVPVDGGESSELKESGGNNKDLR